MKNIHTIFILLLGILSWNNNHAQTTSLGIKGGIQFSSFEGSPFDDDLTTFNSGVTLVCSSIEHWGWGIDALYTRNGGKYSFLQGERMIDNFVFVDYVRVNPKAYYFFRNLDDAFRPKVFLGPALGITTQAYEINTELGYLRHFELLSFEALGGIGFNYEISNNIWFIFDIDYLWGLTKINTIQTFNPTDLTNNALSFNIGIIFGLGRGAIPVTTDTE